MKILIIVASERPPSPDLFPDLPHAYATQIEKLREAGNIIRVFAVDDRTTPGGISRNVRQLRQEIERHQPDLLVTYYGTVTAAVTRLAAGRIPYIVTFRGSDLLGTSNPGLAWRLRDWTGRRLSLWAAAGARQIQVNGQGLRRSLPEKYRHKTHNIPNGIDTDTFQPLPLAEARRQLGWDPDERVILFYSGVGSGQVVKNRPLAQAAVDHLQANGQPVRLQPIATL
ncbi:MAG: glycosyltransferase, partial [Chloroflexota bacterium]